ncbi:hypothetical protein T310_9022, partial [Rasamsonia emersonii CBS 393.64]
TTEQNRTTAYVYTCTNNILPSSSYLFMSTILTPPPTTNSAPSYTPSARAWSPHWPPRPASPAFRAGWTPLPRGSRSRRGSCPCRRSWPGRRR